MPIRRKFTITIIRRIKLRPNLMPAVKILGPMQISIQPKIQITIASKALQNQTLQGR